MRLRQCCGDIDPDRFLDQKGTYFQMTDNARRLIYFEDWMDAPAALATLGEANDIQVDRRMKVTPMRTRPPSLVLTDIRSRRELSWLRLGFRT